MSIARLLRRIAAELEEHRVHVGAVPSDPIRFSDLTFVLTKVIDQADRDEEEQERLARFHE